MNNLVKDCLTRNGNGSGAINGRGLPRRKMPLEQRIGLAADIALGLVYVEPSIKQAAAAVGVSPYRVRTELKARAAAQEVAKRQALQELQANEGTIALVHAWETASDWGRGEAIRIIGVGDVWDVLSPVVG